MKITAVGVAKFVVSGIVGVGTGKLIGKVLKDIVTPESLMDKVTITAATWVISAMATEATKNYSDQAVEKVGSFVEKTIAAVKTGSKLGKINRGESTFEKEGLDSSEFEKNDENKWVTKKTDEPIELEEVVGMIRSGEWNYNIEGNYWFRKKDGGNQNQNYFRQMVEDGGTNTIWVWFKR